MRRGVVGANAGGLRPGWSLFCFAVASPDVPQQPNSNDCGLFALSFFRSFFACPAGERSSMLRADGVGTRAWAESFHLLTRAAMRNLCKTLTEREPDAKCELVDARPKRWRRLRSTRAGAGPIEGGQPSAGPSEGGQPSARPSEGRRPSAGPREGGQPSAGPSEGGRPSAGPSEGGQPSAGPSEGGRPSAGPSEGGQPSAGPSEGGRPSAAYGPLEQTRHTGLGPSIPAVGSPKSTTGDAEVATTLADVNPAGQAPGGASRLGGASKGPPVTAKAHTAATAATVAENGNAGKMDFLLGVFPASSTNISLATDLLPSGSTSWKRKRAREDETDAHAARWMADFRRWGLPMEPVVARTLCSVFDKTNGFTTAFFNLFATGVTQWNPPASLHRLAPWFAAAILEASAKCGMRRGAGASLMLLSQVHTVLRAAYLFYQRPMPDDACC